MFVPGLPVFCLTNLSASGFSQSSLNGCLFKCTWHVIDELICWLLCLQLLKCFDPSRRHWCIVWFLNWSCLHWKIWLSGESSLHKVADLSRIRLTCRWSVVKLDGIMVTKILPGIASAPDLTHNFVFVWLQAGPGWSSSGCEGNDAMAKSLVCSCQLLINFWTLDGTNASVTANRCKQHSSTLWPIVFEVTRHVTGTTSRSTLYCCCRCCCWGLKGACQSVRICVLQLAGKYICWLCQSSRFIEYSSMSQELLTTKNVNW